MDGEHSPACFLSLIIPAYNEADGIAQAIHEADAALAALEPARLLQAAGLVPFEIIIVDDGSRDATADVVREIAGQNRRVRLVQHLGNQGYGAALRSGFAAARGQRIAFTDADCQFYLADLASLIELSDRSPIAIGYRVDRKDSPLREFCSRGYNLLARTLLGTTVRDIDCALKVFRREALAQILPESRGFFVNTELLTRARQRGLGVAEAGVSHRPRLRGKSKVSLFDIPRTLNALIPFWWSQVLFPRRTEPARQMGLSWLAQAAALTLMACLLFFGRLHAPLLEPEEARYAEIPRQMLAQASVITPVLHGEPYYQKPPLLYWLVMGCYSLLGVQDWVARLVPATTGVLIVLLTYAWAVRAVGQAAAFASAAMLCLSAKFIYQAGMLTFDCLLCLCVLMTLACAHRALTGARLRRGWWSLAGVACGFGILAKGPVAVALVAPVMLAWQFVDRRGIRLTVAAWLGWLGITALVSLPWFAAVAWRDASALGDFFWLHNLLRYFRPIDHEQPVWFYLPALLFGMLPWSLLLIPLAGFLTRRSPAAGRRRPAPLGFFLLALLWMVVFFSLSGCKRAGYLLPALPLLALVLGTFVAHGVAWRRLAEALRPRAHPAWSIWAHRATLGTLLAAICVCSAATARGWWPWQSALAIDLMLLALLAALWQRGPSGVAWRGAATCAVVVFTLLLAGVHFLLPTYHRAFALRGQVRRHLEAARDPGLPVASYPKRWDSVSFYLERNDVDAYTAAQRDELIRVLRQNQQTLLFIKQGEALDDLLGALPRDLEFVPHAKPRGRIVSGIVQTKTSGP